MTERRNVPLWLTTAVLAVSGMAASLQLTLTIPLLTAMPDVLSVSANDASWVVTITLLTSAVVTPILSRMADMYGKRRVIIFALIAMTIGSFVIAIGASFPTMILGRGLQGFAQTLIPVGISLLRDLLPRRRVGGAIALMSATLGIGAALGLPLSGVLYDAFGWQSVFWFTGFSGVVFIIGVLGCVHESQVRAPARFDLLGALLLSAILTALLLVISKVGRWDLAVVVGLIGVAAVGVAAWVPLQLRVNNPLVDLRTMARRPVLLTNISALFTTAATFMNVLLTTQQVQAPPSSGHGFGLSVVAAGLVMLPAGLVMVILSPFSGALLNRWGGQRVLIAGNVVVAIAYTFRVFHSDSLPAVIVGVALVGIGMALTFAAMPTLIMASVPLTESASANGINSLVRSFAMCVSSAFLALLVTSMSVEISGHEFLSSSAIHLCFWLAAGCGVVAAVLAAFISVDTRVVTRSEKGHSSEESLIHGRVTLSGAVGPRHPAVVTFMNLEGIPVDWSRADLDGSYSAVLPGPGRYLAVANAAGWAPETHLIDVRDAETTWDSTLSKRLSLSGRIAHSSKPVEGTIVAVHRTGDHIASTRCDAGGNYSLPLPPVGPYVVTAIDTSGQWAHSTKLIVGVQPATLDMIVPS